MSIKDVKVYRLTGEVPNPSVDIYLGDAVHIENEEYSFNFPPIEEDFLFYFMAEDKAYNKGFSSIQHYWDGSDGLQILLPGDQTDILWFTGGGVIKVNLP